MIRHALIILVLVNAIMAMALGAFYELVWFCNDLGISPIWAGIAIVGVVIGSLWRECRDAPLLPDSPVEYEFRQPDGIGEEP
jgi:hypothetical protein